MARYAWRDERRELRACAARAEERDLAEAARAAALDDAATCSSLRARGWPRSTPCLRCERTMTAESPAHRLCEACRRLATEIAPPAAGFVRSY